MTPNKYTSLPPGQRAIESFPRFGLPQYANRFAKELDHIRIIIGGDIDEFEISQDISSLPRVHQVSDFHCVTTWSKLNLHWSGYRFRDFYHTFIDAMAPHDTSHVVLKAQDGYKTSLPLQDLMQDNVILADQLDGKPLGIEHGAPLRLVAPDHYGYKNLKHIKRIEFYIQKQYIKQGILSFMDHPRARVHFEERASNGPGRFFRWLYKFGIKKTMRDFALATESYYATQKSKSWNVK